MGSTGALWRGRTRQSANCSYIGYLDCLDTIEWELRASLADRVKHSCHECERGRWRSTDPRRGFSDGCADSVAERMNDLVREVAPEPDAFSIAAGRQVFEKYRVVIGQGETWWADRVIVE